ncbi:MAG: PBP1A family penicillin-binding protein [Woeseia sp.]
MQDTPRNRQHAVHGFWRRARRWFGLLAGLGLCALLLFMTSVVGAWRYVAPGLPEPETIREIPLQIPLRIFSRDGRLIEEVGERRRIIVEYDELQPFVVDAFVAAEDSRFFTHPGVDYQGILRALLITLRTGELSQGGSTITQQLARDYFLTRERLFTRKLREAFLAWRIEQAFSKQEIMALFLNKMFFGQRAYGVAAAAQVYFGKPLQDINIAEAATLAGVLPAPSNYNPVRSPANARMRRDYVLGRMKALGYIDQAAYDEAMDETLVSQLHGTATELSAPYVAEMVRREMLERYGDDAYTAGYRVVTTIDSRMQRGANYALRNGLLEFTRRRGYRGPISHVDIDPGMLSDPFVEWPADVRLALESYNSPSGLAVALVTELHEDNSATVVLQDGTEVLLPWHGISWARRFIDVETTGPAPETVADVLASGDLVHVMRIQAGGYALAQIPQAQAAVVSLDPYDGAITSLVGGFDYSLSKYNRVTQASRQPGSSFKPFIYSAALEQGNTAATIVTDAPVVISSAQLEAVWRPVNYSGRFYGEQRLREALVRSMNLASVRLLLNHTGIGNTARHLQPFGFSDSTLIRNGSLALGGGNASPLDMAQGYAVFANGGYAVDPYVIDSIFGPEEKYLYRAEPAVVCKRCEPVDVDFDDSTGTIAMYADDDARLDGNPDAGEPLGMSLEEMAEIGETYRPDAGEAPSLYRGMKLAPRVISEQNAFLISDMMRDVIRRGTGVRARVLGRTDLSGKTGTSNDRRDAWFGGFNGDMAAVVWVGYDQDQPLGPGEEGSRTALPIWIEFARVALAGAASHQLPMPDGMVNVRISKSTGCPAGAEVPLDDVMFEVFRIDHVPECAQAEEPDDIFNNDEGFRFGVDAAGAGEQDGEGGDDGPGEGEGEDEDEDEFEEEEPLF